MQGERERCLAAGMDDYLTKPLRNRTLKDALVRWTTGSAHESPDAGRAGVPTTARSARRDPDLLDEAVVADLETLDADVLSGILALYFGEAAGQMTELNSAVGRGEAKAVGELAHRLRGSSSGLGARHVSHLASELEATANRGDLTPADALMARLQSALVDTRTAYGSLVH
jgi:HPt (histidine-containing phosphotransfer) domain-containing protein